MKVSHNMFALSFSDDPKFPRQINVFDFSLFRVNTDTGIWPTDGQTRARSQQHVPLYLIYR